MMPPNSTVPPEAPTLPLEELDHRHGDSQVVLSPVAMIDAGTVLKQRYRLIELIGEGGMGRVYRAEVQGPDPYAAPLAVKVLARPFTEQAGRFAALCTHVDRWRRLTHPNIVKLFDCERDGSIAFITMEYLPGKSTYAMLHQGTSGSPVPLEGASARRIVAAVARGLEYAHAQGVMHADLKPGNVMVGLDGAVKIIDFGLTRWLVRRGAAEAPSGSYASAHYASPQLLAGEEPKAADDVFGLACVAYELLTGAHPFEGEAAARTLELPPPQRPGVSASEYAALVHALQSERERRTSTVRQFMAEFSPPVYRSWFRRWPLLIGAAALLAAFGYFWSHRALAPQQAPANALTPASTSAAMAHAPAPVLAPAAEVPASPPEPAPTATPDQRPEPATATSPDERSGASAAVGSVIRDCPDCPPMTILPPGRFQQGAADDDSAALDTEKPRHWVQIAYPLAMSSTDITVEQFRAFVVATARGMRGCDVYDGSWHPRASASWQAPGFPQTDRDPVVCVSWNDADAYAGWLSAKSGHHYRLPSSSEWEYAARAGATNSAAPWGPSRSDACSAANLADRSAERRYPGWTVFPCNDGYVYTSPVGSFRANAFGLSDLFGNVLVWTQDCWQAGYADAPTNGYAHLTGDCSERELRGGSWFSAPAVVTASYRNHFPADYRTSSLGFRLVREINR